MAKEIHFVEIMEVGKKYKWNYGHEDFPDVPKEDFVGVCTSIERSKDGLEATVSFDKAIVNVTFVNEILVDDTLVEV